MLKDLANTVNEYTSNNRLEDVKKALNEHIILMKTVLNESQKVMLKSNESYQETNEIVEKYFHEKLPTKTQEEATTFELFLKTNPNLKHYVSKKLSVVGGLSEKVFVSRAIDLIFSIECLTKLTWGGTKEKIGFNKMVNINDAIISAGQRVFPSTSLQIVQIVEKTIRNKIKNSNAKLEAEQARAKGIGQPRADYFKKKYNLKKKNQQNDKVVADTE